MLATLGEPASTPTAAALPSLVEEMARYREGLLLIVDDAGALPLVAGAIGAEEAEPKT